MAEGRQALEHGDPRQAAVLLREAESLWRGRPLADLEFEPFARSGGAAARRCSVLAPSRSGSRRSWRSAGTPPCVPNSSSSAGEHPLRERLRGQLMLALYRSGRQADALETYRAGRSLLVEELALEPGPQLRQLQLAILEQDAALELPQLAARRRPRTPAAPPSRRSPPSGEPESDVTLRVRPPPSSPLGCPGARCRRRPRVFAIAPLGSYAHRRAPLNGNVLALYLPATARCGQPCRCKRHPPTWRPGSAHCGSPRQTPALSSASTRGRRAVLATIPVGTRPSRIIAAGGQVWVLDPVNRTVSRIDPQTDTVTQTITVGQRAERCADQRRYLWVANRGDGTVVRLDPSTGRHWESSKRGATPAAWRPRPGRCGWRRRVGDRRADRCPNRRGHEHDSRGRRSRRHLGERAGVWVLDPLDATVSRVDPRRTPSWRRCRSAAARGAGAIRRSLWVADAQDGALLRLDPRRDAVTRFRVGGQASALAATGGRGSPSTRPGQPPRRNAHRHAYQTSTRWTRRRAPRTTCRRLSSSA